MDGKPLHTAVEAEITRVREGTLHIHVIVDISPPWNNTHIFSCLICIWNKGLSVKSAVFADPTDTFFEREIANLKELLSKVGTVGNPYLFLPPTLQKLCLLHHPPGKPACVNPIALVYIQFTFKLTVVPRPNTNCQLPHPKPKALAINPRKRMQLTLMMILSLLLRSLQSPKKVIHKFL